MREFDEFFGGGEFLFVGFDLSVEVLEFACRLFVTRRVAVLIRVVVDVVVVAFIVQTKLQAIVFEVLVVEAYIVDEAVVYCCCTGVARGFRKNGQKCACYGITYQRVSNSIELVNDLRSEFFLRFSVETQGLQFVLFD